MPSSLPQSVREAWGEEVADDFADWLDHAFEVRTVHRDEYREVLSRLDVLEERFDQMETRVDERFDRVDDRLDRMGEKMDQMNDRILSMTRWLIGLLVAFGTMVTVLLGIAQFTT
jgi:tetrahydromethanopterin S-methyltransferase subunit G